MEVIPMNICHALQQRFAAALAGLVEDASGYAELVKPAGDARHGDYQANCAMPLAKVLSRPPREVAQMVIDRLDKGDMLEPPEIAGPGFINLRLRSQWLAAQVQAMARGDRLGVEKAAPPGTYVVDFSSPNVAKPLHVGHLRSTIIGDALARLLRFLGHTVITDNHLGDWGLQFGILLYGYKNHLDPEAYRRDPVQELARLYKLVYATFKKGDDEEEGDDDPIKDACRQETTKLHEGDAENLALWREFMPHCLEEINAIYRRLDIHFDHTRGESYYQPMLCDVVQDLIDKGIARESEGAYAIFFGEDEPPALIQSSHGAYTYTTSDLATIKQRVQEWQPETMLYVVDSRQALHFKNLFAAARRWGYDRVTFEHLSFGSVLGADGKPLKARAGEAALLEELLDNAIVAAREVYERLRLEAIERGEEVLDLSQAEQKQVHEAVGIGAVKYADLSQNRSSDYRFDVGKMTSTEGNTSTYMQYAYARNRSILRKSEVDEAQLRANPPLPDLSTPHERALALQLLRFSEALEAAAADYRPNLITAYLWDLSRVYSGFFQNCPVLRAPTPELRQSRLLLCDLTARVIRQGLELLGIRTIERM
jgi:arginyl-tRNA synthetase